jgi:hypothetical protein
VIIAGTTVSSFNGYNVFAHIKESLLSEDALESKAVSSPGHVVSTVNDYVRLSETYAKHGSCCINKWYGFLGESQPSLHTIFPQPTRAASLKTRALTFPVQELTFDSTLVGQRISVKYSKYIAGRA